MSIWKVYAKKADFKAIGARFGINQVIARIIRNRDVTEDSQYEEYLYGGLESMHDPALDRKSTRLNSSHPSSSRMPSSA